jgi:hypothetical protein
MKYMVKRRLDITQKKGRLDMILNDALCSLYISPR